MIGQIFLLEGNLIKIERPSISDSLDFVGFLHAVQMNAQAYLMYADMIQSGTKKRSILHSISGLVGKPIPSIYSAKHCKQMKCTPAIRRFFADAL